MRQPGWIDRDEREDVSFAGTVVLPDGTPIPVTIADVSEVGCRVECDTMLPIAAIVGLKIGQRTVEAEVRWALPGEAGLRLR